ncbi:MULTISPECIES: hypothetical protein [Flammeovirga]|uniref:Outer membrane protein beta-barrel domain-containing protein n=1 Tax=Flammeovirga agarivorans TaxID=2726742 RepID=A0A7X8SJ84_9BACT|nr:MULTISPECIES: hypothetical protein [Flammeovirga]NLR91137.1 hypothetical protein [Flammeovirga agarivorans]
MNKIILSVVAILTTLSYHLQAQTEENHTKSEEHHQVTEHHFASHENEHEGHKKHKVSFYMGYTMVPQAVPSHDLLLVPTFGIDYTYKLSKKFSIGVVNDIEIAQYMVEIPAEGGSHGEHGGATEELEREFAYVGAVILYYSPLEGWNIGIGPGVELEKNKNFFVGKVIIEKEFELPGHWALSPSFQYDIKGNVYDAWSLGVSFGKCF